MWSSTSKGDLMVWSGHWWLSSDFLLWFWVERTELETGWQCSDFFVCGCAATCWPCIVIGQVLKAASVDFYYDRSRLILVMISCFEILAGFLIFFVTFFLHWAESQDTWIIVPTRTWTCSVTLDKFQMLWVEIFLFAK